MERKQFTFYESFEAAIRRIRCPEDRLAAYELIVAYALHGTEPDLDALPDTAAIVFSLIRPTLDASMRKAFGGQRGGQSSRERPFSLPEESRGAIDALETAKHSASICEAEPKLGASEGEKEKENEIEKEIEKENETESESYCCFRDARGEPPQPQQDTQAFFQKYFVARPSPLLCAELGHFNEALGPPVVLHAMQFALDAGKSDWAYVRAILRRYEREGLTTLEAVRDSERLHDARRDALTAKNAPPPLPSESIQADLDELKRVLESLQI